MHRNWLYTRKAAIIAVVPLTVGLSMSPAYGAAANPGNASPQKIAAEDVTINQDSEQSRGGETTAPRSSFQESEQLPVSLDAHQQRVPTLEEQAKPLSEEQAPGTPQAMQPSVPVLPEGDDSLPSVLQTEGSAFDAENPLEAPRDASGAFLPPSGIKVNEQRGADPGAEMMNILGSEVFNRRVNITTPPDTDVSEVIRLLAERAGLNFVYAEGVIRGRVTLNLRDVPLGVALQSLLASQQLALVREGSNVMRIVARRDIQATAVETRTIYVRLNWVPAASLEGTLRTFVTPGTGSIKSHTESNTLILTDTPSNVALVRDLIAQLDVPEKQVMIEARMVELLISNARQLGSRTVIERPDSSKNSEALGQLDGNAAHTETQRQVVIDPDTGKPSVVENETAVGAVPVDTWVNDVLVGANAAGRITFGGVLSIFGKQFDISATLDALETRNVVNTLANPTIITLNNEAATIEIKRELPYLEAQQGVSQGAVAASVKFKDAGVRLTVIPTITNNGFVRMRLEPEQLINSGNFLTPQGAIPIIDRRSAMTNVIVKDEDTVVLGGLREIDSSDAKRQFPWISQVPVIGWFFKNDARQHTKNDLMLFVTPHIVKAPVLSPAQNYKYSRLDAHWDLPDYFFDDSVEIRERRHRGEADFNAQSYAPQTMKLPPPAVVVPGAAPGAEAVTSGTPQLQPPPAAKAEKAVEKVAEK